MAEAQDLPQPDFQRQACPMAEEASSSSPPEGWPINELWAKYEDIAMHFNDLLIRLRTQALGAVAAISALVGLFGKDASNVNGSWEVAAIVFAFLLLFWLAVWLIDFLYYNRLLLGAADALFRLEEASKTQTHIKAIDMSLSIERFVSRRDTRPSLDRGDARPSAAPRLVALAGRWAFYSIVAASLAVGFGYSLYRYWNTSSTAPASIGTSTAPIPAAVKEAPQTSGAANVPTQSAPPQVPVPTIVAPAPTPAPPLAAKP